jgi:hypothetical protein
MICPHSKATRAQNKGEQAVHQHQDTRQERNKAFEGKAETQNRQTKRGYTKASAPQRRGGRLTSKAGRTQAHPSVPQNASASSWSTKARGERSTRGWRRKATRTVGPRRAHRHGICRAVGRSGAGWWRARLPAFVPVARNEASSTRKTERGGSSGLIWAGAGAGHYPACRTLIARLRASRAGDDQIGTGEEKSTKSEHAKSSARTRSVPLSSSASSRCS